MAKPHELYNILEAISETVVLIFDNSTLMLHQINSLLTQFAQLKFPPVLLLSIRTNQINRLNFHKDTDIIALHTTQRQRW